MFTEVSLLHLSLSLDGLCSSHCRRGHQGHATLFEVSVPYSSSFSFFKQVTCPAGSLGVLFLLFSLCYSFFLCPLNEVENINGIFKVCSFFSYISSKENEMSFGYESKDIFQLSHLLHLVQLLHQGFDQPINGGLWINGHHGSIHCDQRTWL